MGLTDVLRRAAGGAAGGNDPGTRAAEMMARAGAPPSLVDLVGTDAAWLESTLCARNVTRSQDWAAWKEREAQIHAGLAAADDTRRRAAVAYVYAALAAQPNRHYIHYSTPQEAVLSKLARRKLPWTAEEVSWMLHLVAASKRDTRHYLVQLASLPLTAASRLSDDEVPALAEGLNRLAAALSSSPYQNADVTRAQRRVTEQLDRAEPARALDLPEDVLGGNDTFARPARTALLEEFGPASAGQVLRHLADAGTAVTPTRKWRSQTTALVTSNPDAVPIARFLLQRALAHREAEVQVLWGGHRYAQLVFADDSTAAVLRGAVWVLAAEQSVETIALLGDAGVHCGSGMGGSSGTARCSQVTTSAVAVLAAAAGDDELAPAVVAQLSRLQERVRNKTIRKSIDRALETAAAAAGLTPGQLLERSVPDFGLDWDGTAQVPAGEHTALLRLTTRSAGARLEVTWRTPGGRTVKSTPSAVREGHPDLLRELRATSAQAKKAAATQRARLEDLLAVGRTWDARQWALYYPAHPVVGLTARSLIWQARPAGTHGDDGWASGLPVRDDDTGWSLVDHDGTAHRVDDRDEIRLWHPIRQPLADVQAWREHLTASSRRQPFKQAFREIYLLTPAEESTGTYSNRFAAHILRYPQAGALIRTRGWSGPHLGYWDGGYDATATKTIGEDGWRACFDYSLVERDEDHYGTVSLAATDQVRFERWTGLRDGQGWRAQPLADVPALVFSEAMRDVDLFVGVTSIASDPTWADRGTDRHRDYWHQTSFGELTESAQVRKEALAALLPRTRLASRARLDGNYLVVSGHLRDYRIHLGSTNILMSPADTYLCIVPARKAKDPNVFLPFEEGGGKLSVILSKAFLLAEDTSISDPTITHQLRAGLR